MTRIDLSGVERRLDWAHSHIERFEDEARRFIKTDPYELVSEIEPETRDQLARIQARRPVPPELPLIVGDAIHSLRSSLDHIAYLLAMIPESHPTNIGRVAFPVCQYDSGKGHQFFSAHEAGGTLGGILMSGIQAIRDCQPYKRANSQTALDLDTLWRLHRLWNDDKHKAVNLLGCTVLAGRIRVTNFHISLGDGEIVPAPSVTHGPIYEGGEAARIPRAFHENGGVEARIAYGIALDPGGAGKGALLPNFLHEAHQFIRDEVIPTFRQDFT